MDTNTLLDEIKKRYDLTSEYALSKKLEVTRQGLANIREKGFSDERALQAATFLELNHAEVLAAISAERAKSPAVREVWKKIEESMRSVMGLAAMVAVAISLALPPKVAQASGDLTISSNTPYIMRHWLRRRVRAFQRAWRLSFGLAACFLVACGGSQTAENDNHGFGWSYDAEGATGLQVKYAGDATPSVEEIEHLFAAVKTCMAMDANPPLVIFSDHMDFPDRDGSAFTDTNSALILAGMPAQRTRFVLTHEFVHLILGQNGFPYDRNSAHDSPFFYHCTAHTDGLKGLSV